MAIHTNQVCSTHGLTKFRVGYDKRYIDRSYITCCLCDKERVNKNRKEKKLRAILYKGSKCSRCGLPYTKYQTVFEFHHTDPKKKEGSPSEMTTGKWSKLKEELDKCILLCANCHRIVHEEERCISRR